MSDLPRYWTPGFTEVYLKAMNASSAFQKAAAKMDETIVLRCLDDPDGLDQVVAYRIHAGRIEVVDERTGPAPSPIRNEPFDGSRFLARTTAPYAFWKRLDAKEIGVLHVITSPEYRLEGPKLKVLRHLKAFTLMGDVASDLPKRY
jgi:hypothetical protein